MDNFPHVCAGKDCAVCRWVHRNEPPPPYVPDRRIVGIHGRYTTYTNWACRCDLCKAAARAYWAQRKGKIA